MAKIGNKATGKRARSARSGPPKSRNSSVGAVKKARSSVNGSYAAHTQKPRIAGVNEREANIERATSRIKTAVKVDLARSRHG